MIARALIADGDHTMHQDDDSGVQGIRCVALSLFELLARECNRYHALPSGGALGFVLWQMGGVSLRAVQGRLHYHDRGH